MNFSRLPLPIILLGVGAAITMLTVIVLMYVSTNWPLNQTHQASIEKPTPSINCVFYDLTRASVVVAFDFAVTPVKGSPPRFEERAEAARDGTQKAFEDDERPVWPFAPDGDGNPQITSPDGATRIVLYGLKLETPGEIFIEAGLRSNVYKNLNGQCRQTNFGGDQQAAAGSTP